MCENWVTDCFTASHTKKLWGHRHSLTSVGWHPHLTSRLRRKPLQNLKPTVPCFAKGGGRDTFPSCCVLSCRSWENWHLPAWKAPCSNKGPAVMKWSWQTCVCRDLLYVDEEIRGFNFTELLISLKLDCYGLLLLWIPLNIFFIIFSVKIHL